MKLPRTKNLWENTPFLVAVSGMATTLIMIYALRLWRADLFYSFTADKGQAAFSQMLIQNLMETGWFQTASRLGGEGGQQLWGYPWSDSLHAALLLLISWFTKSAAATQNLYFLLSFPLATMSAVLALRSLKLSPAASVFSGILYAFMPYHFWRGTGDLLLSAYYMVPLGICLALWTMEGRLHLEFSRKNSFLQNMKANKHLLGPVVIALGISSTGIHYAFFALVLVFIAILWRVFRDYKVTRSTAGGILSGLLILFGVLLNRLPSWIYSLSGGETTVLFDRAIQTGEVYSLKLIDLIIPNSMHQTWTFRYMVSVFRAAEPVTNENTSVALGILGACGLMLLLLYPIFMSRPNTPEKKLYRNVAVLTYGCLLLSSFGGFCSAIYRFALKDVYSYYQICVFIFFLSLTALSLCIDAIVYGKGSTTKKDSIPREKESKAGRFTPVYRRYRQGRDRIVVFYRKHRTKLAVLLLPLLFVGLFDIIPFEAAYSYGGAKATETIRSAFFEDAEKTLGKDAYVFLLPYTAFPKSEDATGTDPYIQLLPYLYTDSLHISSGAVRGSKSDAWYQSVAALRGAELIACLRQSGYTAIYIDLENASDGSLRKLSEDLSSITGHAPIRSDDGNQCLILLS